MEENDQYHYQNEIAGYIETIKRHEQEIVDLKRHINSLNSDMEIKNAFVKNQSNLCEELKGQLIKRERQSLETEV